MKTIKLITVVLAVTAGVCLFMDVANAVPDIHYRKYFIIDDWSNIPSGSFMVNGDRRLNPGERVELQLEVKNSGDMLAQEVSATLSLLQADQYITISDGRNTVDFGDIPAGATALSTDTFLIEAAGDTPDNHRVNFNIEINDQGGYQRNEQFQLAVIIMDSSGHTTAFAASDIRLDTDLPVAADSNYHRIAGDDYGNVYIVWEDDRNDPDPNDSSYIYDIYFNYSTDYGATWQENDIMINTGGPSRYPQVSCDSSGHVYVVWEDLRDGPRDIYFNYSTDYGAAWQTADVELDREAEGVNDRTSRIPQISSDNNGHVYVVWYDYRNGRPDIYFNYSQDFGAAWLEEDMRLDTDEANNIHTADYPAISSNDSGGVYVVWQDNRNDPDRRDADYIYDIYFNYSTDYGATWQTEDIRLDTGSARSGEQIITCDDNGNVYVAWQKWNAGNGVYDIYVNSSSDNGSTWRGETRLDTDELPGGADSLCPSISCDNNGGVYVGWKDKRNGDPHRYDVYFNYSTNSGDTWQSEDIRLDTDVPEPGFSSSPEIACDERGVYAVWHDYRNTYSDIFFNYSFNAGDTTAWQANERVFSSYLPGVIHSRYPAISSGNNGDVYVAWRDWRNGSSDVYFAPAIVSKELPTLNSIADYTITEGDPLTFTVTAANSAGTTLELFWDTQGLPPALEANISSATFTDNRDNTGTFSWQTQAGAGFPGEYYPVVFAARDVNGRCDYQAITIDVMASANNPPVLDPIGNQSATVGQVLTINVSASDDDPGDSLTYTHPLPAELPQGANFADHGDGTGTFTWTPTETQSGPHQIPFEVEDTGGLTDSETITITVSPGDQNPPSVTIISPEDGLVTADRRQPFQANVSDEALDWAKLWLDPLLEPDGRPVDGEEPVTTWNLTGQTTVTLDYSHSSTMPLGNHFYILIVSDTSANETLARADFEVVEDTVAPEITNVIPPPPFSQTTDRLQPFHADVSDNVLLAEAALVLNSVRVLNIGLDGQAAEIDFTPEVQLEIGEPYYYYLLVVDSSGNEATVTTSFIIEPPPINIPGCFLAGTPILMADGSSKPIEGLRVGDTLLAYDEETGELKEDTVKKTFVHPGCDGYLVINGHLKVTSNHPVYHDGKWVEIGTLKVGDELLDAGGEPELIASVKSVKNKVTVYNIEVNPYHTYIAGGIVVHNKSFGPVGGGPNGGGSTGAR